MYRGAICVWRWFKQLTRAEERPLNKSIESIDAAKQGDFHHRSQNLLWNTSDLIYVTTCFQIDIIYLCNMGYMLKQELNPGFIQVIIMYVTLGPALIYMEIFLGQYVHHGCLYLRNVSPLTCSAIGYGMLLTMYFFSIASVSRLADCYMYLFRTISSELPWMVCPKDSTPATCIDRELLMKCYLENRKDNCYPKLTTEILSSRIYYKKVHPPLLNRLPLLLIAWFTIYVTIKRSLSHSRAMVKKLLLLMLALFLCLLAPLLIHVNRGLSVAPFFTLRFKALVNTSSWMAAFRYFLRDHAVVRGGYQLMARHIRPGPAAANLTIYSCAITYLINISSQIFSTGILGVLIHYMKITRVEEELYFPRYAKLFSFYPFAFGMLEVRQFWSLIYFLLVVLSAISYSVINLTIIEETVYDQYPIMLRYRTYVRVILCILGFVITASTDFLSDVNSYEEEILLRIGYRLTVIIVLILALSIGYIYGVERFSDDMNFLNGSQPATYWKICWKCLPVALLLVLGGDITHIEFPRDNVSRLISNIVYVLLLCLGVLHLVHRVVVSIKARNVTGMLLQATPEWGPILPEDRKMRNTYNPREETKYWRKNSTCTHHCLLDKDFILSVIRREVDYRTAKARRDTVVSDIGVIANQSKLNQVVVAIDKVSSAQLETFEEQVRQKVKYLEEIEKAQIELKRKDDLVSKKHLSMTESMEKLDREIEEMLKRVEGRDQPEKEKDIAKAQRTSSKTKQRRLPTYVPKVTPRSKKTGEATTSVEKKDKKDGEPTKFQTYAVQVPHFVLEPQVKILTQSVQVKSKRIEKPRSSAPARGILQIEDAGPSHIVDPNESRLGLQVFRGSKVPAKRLVSKPRRQMMRKARLPAWPLPPNTPRPTVSPRQSRSSSSTSTASRETYREPSTYFLDVRLPPKANLPLPAFSVDIHSLPRSPRSSTASLQLSELYNDPVLHEILYSVHPELFLREHNDIPRASSRVDTFRGDTLTSNRRNGPQPRPRTLIGAPAGSQSLPQPLPRNRKLSSPPIPAPRPRPTVVDPISPESGLEEDMLRPADEGGITDSPAVLSENESNEKMANIAEEQSALDIDQAIQIRIRNLLHGIRDPGQSSGQRPGSLSTRQELGSVSMTEGMERENNQGEGTSRNSSNRSKTKKKSLTTNSLAARISAFGKRIANRMTRGSNVSRINQMSERNVENHSQESQETVKDVSPPQDL